MKKYLLICALLFISLQSCSSRNYINEMQNTPGLIYGSLDNGAMSSETFSEKSIGDCLYSQANKFAQQLYQDNESLYKNSSVLTESSFCCNYIKFVPDVNNYNGSRIVEVEFILKNSELDFQKLSYFARDYIVECGPTIKNRRVIYRDSKSELISYETYFKDEVGKNLQLWTVTNEYVVSVRMHQLHDLTNQEYDNVINIMKSFLANSSDKKWDEDLHLKQTSI